MLCHTIDCSMLTMFDEHECSYQLTAICLLSGPFYLNKMSNRRTSCGVFTALSFILSVWWFKYWKWHRKDLPCTWNSSTAFFYLVQKTEIWTFVFYLNCDKWNDYYESKISLKIQFKKGQCLLPIIWWPNFQKKKKKHLVLPNVLVFKRFSLNVNIIERLIQESFEMFTVHPLFKNHP